MPRKHYILGVALAATIVAGAWFVPAAWATEGMFTSGSDWTALTARSPLPTKTTSFHMEDEHTELTGGATASQVLKFGSELQITCKAVAFSGTFQSASKSAEQLSLSLAYSECKFKGPEEELTAHITVGGCKLVLQATASASVSCNAEEMIEITVTIAGKSQSCISVPAQSLGTVNFTPTGSGASRELDLTPAFNAIHYTRKGVCGEGGFENGSYSGGSTLRGKDSEGSEGIWVETEEEEGVPFVFLEGGLEISCEGLNGVSNVGTTSTALTIEPAASSSCQYGASAAQTISNGCHYDFGAEDEGEAHGEFQINCPEGKQMELQVFLLGKFRPCRDFPAQTPTVPAIDYTNGTEITGGKNIWNVTVDWTVEGLEYSKTSVCGSGTFDGGTMQGEAKIWGADTEGNPLDVTWDAPS